MDRNAVIVLCAGQGKRMGRRRPKMFLEAAGRPLFYWTLRNLERCPAVQALVLAVPEEYCKTAARQVAAWKFKKVVAIVPGGRERVDSTRNALRAVPDDCRWVAVHDGARPFVPPALVRECFKAAHRTGGAILAVPSKDTVKVVEGAVIRRTIPRGQCWAAQTPQVFRRDVAWRIHGLSGRRPKGGAASFTDDASLAESCGYEVRIVPSTYENIKITTPEDLRLAETMIRRLGWR